MPADYTPTNQCPTRVFVNGTRIPAAEVDVHLRKEGPLDITRYAEATFASPFKKEDYLSLFSTLTDDSSQQDDWDILRIDCADNGGENYQTLFHGMVTGIGNSAQHDNERIHQCRAQGPSHFLDKIPASKTINKSIQVKDILSYVSSELNNTLPSSFTISTSPNQTEQSVKNTVGVLNAPGSAIAISLVSLFQDTSQLTTPKSFTANKHLLSDVISWLRDKLQVRLWIQPSPNGGILTGGINASVNSQNHKAHYLTNGDTQIINNNAAAELRPLNTIIVNGRASETKFSVGDFEYNVNDDDFIKVKARHKPLYQRAGQTELTDTVRKSDGQSKTEVENEAKSILKDRIDEATAGSMQVVHNRLIQPFDTIEAKPTVAEQPQTDVESLTYEVNRCHYKAHPNSDTIPHIDCNVGIHTDIESDIEIIDSWEADA